VRNAVRRAREFSRFVRFIGISLLQRDGVSLRQCEAPGASLEPHIVGCRSEETFPFIIKEMDTPLEKS
jgi:hypothetical protein